MKSMNVRRSILVLTFLSIAALAGDVPNPAFWSGLHYRMIGPDRGGRVTTVTGVPTQPQTFYMGSTGGGVWKTTDAGHSWKNISDGFFSVASMGAIDVALSDPNVIYAGTGSSKIRSNVSIGRGIYKSGDAGKTWTFAGLRANATFAEAFAALGIIWGLPYFFIKLAEVELEPAMIAWCRTTIGAASPSSASSIGTGGPDCRSGVTVASRSSAGGTGEARAVTCQGPAGPG